MPPMPTRRSQFANSRLTLVGVGLGRSSNRMTTSLLSLANSHRRGEPKGLRTAARICSGVRAGRSWPRMRHSTTSQALGKAIAISRSSYQQLTYSVTLCPSPGRGEYPAHETRVSRRKGQVRQEWSGSAGELAPLARWATDTLPRLWREDAQATRGAGGCWLQE